MRRSIRPALAAAVAATTLLGGCATLAETGEGTGAAGTPAEIAATVSGTEVTRAQVEADVEEQRGLLDEVPAESLAEAEAQLERDVLGSIIQLLAVEAAVEAEFGLDVEDARVDELVEESIESAGGEAAFDELADQQGLTPEVARSFARESAYVQALVEYVNVKLLERDGIDEARIQAEYDDNPDRFQSSDARHILVETEAEALAILERLNAGEDFGELATELSQDPGSGANGGALGVAPRGSYVQEFQDAIYAPDTVIGEVLGPIESQFGFHLIIVDEIIVSPFDEVRDQIEQELGSEGFTTFLNTAFDEIDLELDPYYGTWDVAGRQVTPPASATDDAESDDASEPAVDAEDQDASEPAADSSEG